MAGHDELVMHQLGHFFFVLDDENVCHALVLLPYYASSRMCDYVSSRMCAMRSFSYS